MQRRNSSAKLPRSPSTASSRLSRRLSSPNVLKRLSSSSELFKKFSPSKDKEKERLHPNLRWALDLLNLPDLEALEQYFLKTDAFLKPWTHFRDTFLLLQPNGIPNTSPRGAIQRLDILYYYTLFDEGEKRYDACADPDSPYYTGDTSKHDFVDKSWWTVVEHEKLLYVWLLQSFKVGKSNNPYDFEYFECKNVCTAWEDVFVPIVEAVRNDYNSRGRFHYGRLAKLVEEAAPSGLAFPGYTSGTTQGVKLSIIPGFRLTRRPVDVDPVTGMLMTRKKIWDEAEKELRQVYPQYGQVVERPKMKTRIEDWLKEQKEMIHQKRALWNFEGKSNGIPKNGRTTKVQIATDLRENSNVSKEPKKQAAISPYKKHNREESDYSNSNMSISTTPRPSCKRESSDGVYSSIRSSNPWSDEGSDVFGPSPAGNGKKHTRSATVPVEPKPSPLEQPFGDHQRSISSESTRSGNGPRIRYPSYEGNGYGYEQMPTLREVNSTEKVRPTRIPSPIDIPPNETTRKYHPIVERAIQRAESTPTTDELAPPVPTKNPQRCSSKRTNVVRHAQFASEKTTGALGPRIISKENIRTALDLSRENSEEYLKTEAPRRQISVTDRNGFARIGGRGLNTGESPTLPTFNTHLFPREGRQTPVGGHRRRYGSSDLRGSFEMEMLSHEK